MRSMKHLGPGLALAAVAALCMAGCGGDDTPATTPPPTTGAAGGGSVGGGGGPIGAGAGGGSGGGSIYSGGSSGGSGTASSGGGDAKDPDGTTKPARESSDGRLRLRAVPHVNEVRRGEPMLMDLILTNVGRENVRLVRPQRDLAENFTLRAYDRSDVLVLRRRGWTMDNPPTGLKVETLEPRQSVKATVDLQPMLEGTPGYARGGMMFDVVYQGAAELMPGEPDLWNPSGAGQLVVRKVFMEVMESDWLLRYEEDEEKLRARKAEVLNAVNRWHPEEPQAAAKAAQVAEGGEFSVACLVHLIQQLDQPDPKANATAGLALAMARTMPEAAQTVLLRATRETPHEALHMARAVIEEDQRIAANKPPSGGLKAVRSVGAGQDAGASIEFRAIGSAKDATTFIVHADGKVDCYRQQAGKDVRFALVLRTDQMVALKRALIESRVWCWRGVRVSPKPGEGSYRVSLRDKSGFRFETVLLENEARKSNPLSKPVFELLDGLVKDLGAPPEQARDR